MKGLTTMGTSTVLIDVLNERMRQLRKWGSQHRPEFPLNHNFVEAARECNSVKALCDVAERAGPQPGFTGGADWKTILEEEFLEAISEPELAKRRKELIEVAAVAVAWAEDLDAHCT